LLLEFKFIMAQTIHWRNHKREKIMKVDFKKLTGKVDGEIHVKVWPWLEEACKRKAKQAGMKYPDWVRETLIRAVEK